MLFNLNDELFQLKTQVYQFQGLNMSEEMQQKLRTKWLMIFGEGFVFLTLLAVGILQTRKSFHKEALLARQQNNFLLSITHELKSPLASIKLYLQTIAKRDLDKEQKQSLVSRAVGDTDRLNSLVENILLVSRIDNHAEFLQLNTIDLSAICQSTCAQFQSENHVLETSIADNIFIQGDALAMQSILINLLDNATKYSPESTKVKLKLYHQSDHAFLEVHDWGIGISNEDKLRIFERFYRAGNEETRMAKGTGLGLYIVSYIARQHKAKINVMDNVPSGTIFQLIFKLSNS
jgi:two-component system, OmpR family, phosphate regulon sensor histidine kinase PhoR